VESAVTVRIEHATPWPGDVGDGKTLIVGYLVVLADDAGHRAVPVWLLHGDRAGGESLRRLVEEPGGVTVTAGVPEELGTRLLRAAAARRSPSAPSSEPRTLPGAPGCSFA
jgi:hypothetical protein